MRVVVDTVVFVRALINPYGLWGELVFGYADRYDLVVSRPIVSEILEVLQRSELTRKYRTDQTRTLDSLITRLTALQTVELEESIPPISRDPSDDKFLAMAKAADASYVVSEDQDLLTLSEYAGIPIIDGRTFLQLLEQIENNA